MPWIDACAADEIDKEDVIRWDHDGKTYAIIHGVDGVFYCIDGLCSHEKIHLADGLVMGYEIECPKHSGLFDYGTGEATRPPACDDIKTYETENKDGRILVLVE